MVYDDFYVLYGDIMQLSDFRKSRHFVCTVFFAGGGSSSSRNAILRKLWKISTNDACM